MTVSKSPKIDPHAAGGGSDAQRVDPRQEQFEVPIVLIIFSRPDVTRRVFESIARLRPSRLFVIADGARPGRAGEADRVAAVRAIVESVDWPCEVNRAYASENLGCRRRVVSGLNWVFDQVEHAIILEDDCLASPAFFRYCEEMLETYRADPRVFAVSGSNFRRRSEPPGHYLSNFALMWGWATWRDRWRQYVPEPTDHTAIVRRMWWRRPLAWAYWSKIYRMLDRRKTSSIWDYQWILTLWRQRALACRPTVNLVENIGFGVDATHTTSAQSRVAGLPAEDPEGSFRRRVGPMRADSERDRIDESEWALINIRSLALMYLPFLERMRARTRR